MKYLLANSTNQTRGFSFIEWSELIGRVSNPPMLTTSCPNQAKKESQAITASDTPSKKLEALKKHNRFTLLRLDLDDTPHNMHSIKHLLGSLDIHSYLIHTTANHCYQGKGSRYRVYIELQHALTLDEWRIVQTFLAYSLGADDCSNRPQQIMYLPSRFAGGEYHFHINEGVSLKVYGSQLFNDAIAFDVEQKRQAEAIEQAKANQIKPQHQERLIEGQVSIIDAVNIGYEWPTLLEQYGYKRQGRAWLPPESRSKSAGVYLLIGHDGKQRYYSHHENDPCALGKCIDKFDFIAIRSFGGDRFSALKAVSKHFPEHDRHNKQQYMRYKQATELMAIKEALYND